MKNFAHKIFLLELVLFCALLVFKDITTYYTSHSAKTELCKAVKQSDMIPLEASDSLLEMIKHSPFLKKTQTKDPFFGKIKFDGMVVSLLNPPCLYVGKNQYVVSCELWHALYRLGKELNQ